MNYLSTLSNMRGDEEPVKEFNVAVVGATGAVGQKMREILEERNFPIKSVRFLASERSHGKELLFKGDAVRVETLTKDSFKDIDIALFSAGGDRSLEFAPAAVASGAVVIDNSNAWRMDPSVPLVVPEVNPEDVKWHKGIIANPNCSTIQMVVALKPLHDAACIKRIVVSTYQAVSGTGQKAIDELKDQSDDIAAGRKAEAQVYKEQIAFNLLPEIDVFMDNDYTKEEMKMVNETRKMFHDDSIGVTATCVRVPVYFSHSECVNIETERKLSADEARDILAKAPGVKVVDDPANRVWPTPLMAAGRDETFVGRIREDESIDNGLNLWVVSDNLRKGAALNAIQIAELL
jgi:aspartate-semialdehyde dehydrogenase